MQLKFNALDAYFKSVKGAVKQGQTINFRVNSVGFGECVFYIRQDQSEHFEAYPMQRAEGGFFVSLKFNKEGLFWYYFEADGVRFGKNFDQTSRAYSYDNFQLSVYKKGYKTPKFLKGGTIYQIFPDRFNKSGDFEVEKGKEKRLDWGGLPIFRNSKGLVLNNEFFGGNFKGIEEKLDYLKGLGVTTVYLNPICKAYSSHRYDTADYLEFDSVLGTEEELKSLLNKAKELGISFIFDGVYNHVGSDSVYFNKNGAYSTVGAYQSKDSPYFSWFDFIHFPNKYRSWWDFETLPSINKKSKAFQDFICEKVIKKYMKLGFMGVRLDVVDELDGAFVKAIRKAVKEVNPDGVVIGEVWEDATNKIAYGERREYFLGEELDSVMNYPLKDSIINYLLSRNTYELKKTLLEQINNYPKDALNVLMNVLSTHDTPRIITVLGRNSVITDKDQMAYEVLTEEEYEKGVTLAKMAYAIAFTVYGAPSVYYGDEAGVWGNLDPYNRKCYPWGKEDKELLEFIKTLGKIRAESKVFEDGDFRILFCDEKTIVYERFSKTDSVTVCLTTSSRAVKLSFERDKFNLLNGKIEGKTIELKPLTVAILKNEK